MLNSNLSNNFNWSTYSHVRQLGLDVTCTTNQIIDKLAAKGAGSMLIMAAFRPTDYPNIRWANTAGQHMYTVKCYMRGYVSIIDEDINNGILHYCTHYGDNYSDWDNILAKNYEIIKDAGVTCGATITVKSGAVYLAIDVVVPQMAAWSSFRLGYVPDWAYGVKVLGTAHSILGTQSSAVRIDISEAGVVTVNTQAAIAGNQWFYGRNSVYL